MRILEAKVRVEILYYLSYIYLCSSLFCLVFECFSEEAIYA